MPRAVLVPNLYGFDLKFIFTLISSAHSRKLILVHKKNTLYSNSPSLQQLIFLLFLAECDLVVLVTLFLFSNKVIPRDGVCLQEQLWDCGTFLKHISVQGNYDLINDKQTCNILKQIYSFENEIK